MPRIHVEEFFNYATERYRIKLRRDAGDEFPWTDDPVLRDYRFCHVFREEDRTTVWFRENIRSQILRESDRHVVLAVAGFRWFTLISAGEAIKDVLLDYGWNTAKIKKRLRGWTPPLVTGAYMVTSPRGMNKLDGICHAMKLLGRQRKMLDTLGTCSLQEAHRRLMEVPYLGDFRAYEIVTDLRHTGVLVQAPDIMTWANAGPGAIRGLNWVFNKKFTRKKTELPEMQVLMQELLRLSGPDSFHWPEEWPAWEMREVEHTLCEFDKYKRGCRGERLKRRYRVGESQ